MEDEAKSKFVWNEYIQDEDLVPADVSAFPHVCLDEKQETLQVQPGTILEVEDKERGCCWLADVTLVYGSLLRLKYISSEPCVPADFWCDYRSGRLHARGWSQASGVPLSPPDGVVTSPETLAAALAEVQPPHLPGRRAVQLESLVEGAKLELLDETHPCHVWTATVLGRVGERLRLRRDTLQEEEGPVWLSVASPRLRHLGWADETGAPFEYRPPADVASLRTDDEWRAIQEMCTQEARSAAIDAAALPPVEPALPPPHGLSVGCKLEAVHPNRTAICPATVDQLLDSYFFRVRIDDTDVCFTSSLMDSSILPHGWCAENGVKLGQQGEQGPGNEVKEEPRDIEEHPNRPDGCHPTIEEQGDDPDSRFHTLEEQMRLLHDDHENLMEAQDELEVVPHDDLGGSKVAGETTVSVAPIAVSTSSDVVNGEQSELASPRSGDASEQSSAASRLHADQLAARPPAELTGLSAGSALEVVHPHRPDTLCAASVSSAVGHLLWLRVLPLTSEKPLIYSCDSQLLLPVGWAERHGAVLLPPLDWRPRNLLDTSDSEPMEVNFGGAPAEAALAADAPQLYLHLYPDCHCGPALSRSRLSTLPQLLGPAPPRQLARQLLRQLLSCSHQAGHMLRQLQLVGPPPPGATAELIRVKTQESTHGAVVEVPTSEQRLGPFCAAVTARLQCCPSLVLAQRRSGPSCPYSCGGLPSDVVRTPPPLPTPPSPKRAASQTSEASPAAPETKRPRAQYLQPARKSKRSAENGCDPQQEDGKPALYQLSLETSPRLWDSEQLEQYLSNTDCCHLAATLRQQEVDGVAFMLVTLASLVEVLQMSHTDAAALCAHAARLKYTCFTVFGG